MILKSFEKPLPFLVMQVRRFEDLPMMNAAARLATKAQASSSASSAARVRARSKELAQRLRPAGEIRLVVRPPRIHTRVRPSQASPCLQAVPKSSLLFSVIFRELPTLLAWTGTTPGIEMDNSIMWTLLLFLVIIPAATTLLLLVVIRKEDRGLLLPCVLLRTCYSCAPRHRGHATNVPETAVEHSSGVSAVAKLAAAVDQANLLQGRVLLFLAQMGATMLMIGLMPLFLWVAGIDLSHKIGACTYYLGSTLCGLPVLLLAITPDDHHAINIASRCFFWIMIFICPVAILLAWVFRQEWVFFSAYLAVALLLPTVSIGIAPAVFDGASCKPSAMPLRLKLRRIWLMCRVLLFGVGCIFSYIPLGFVLQHGTNATDPETLDQILDQIPSAHIVINSSFAYGLAFCAAFTLLAALVFSPANRGRFLRRLHEIGKIGSAQQEAATIASLIGGTNAELVYATAASKFTVLPLASLTVADLTSNEDTGLNTRVRAATLGECDAFMSHSWRDDGAEKHARLEEWGTACNTDHATIWLDKACIDQVRRPKLARERLRAPPPHPVSLCTLSPRVRVTEQH